MLTGGGAGYGDPADRPRDLIEHDLAQGLLAPATARRLYGAAVHV
jgi:N-methylhydantoinase B